MNLQPTLQNETILLQPLVEDDFERLYSVASNPKVWEQHPNKDRYKREVFENYFKGAIESKGAFLIIDKITKEVIGCTRYYDYNSENNSVLIGYTFNDTKYWGKGINTQIKSMMINYAFQFVDKIHLHVGAYNIRSQIAVGRIGGIKTREFETAYYGEMPSLNFEYTLNKPKGNQIY